MLCKSSGNKDHRRALPPDHLVKKVSSKLWNFAVINLIGPLIQFFSSTTPEFPAQLKILKNNFPLIVLQEFFCEEHVWSERI